MKINKRQENPPPKSVASVVRLDRTNRFESIISILTADWCELVDLLADPQGYIKSKQFLFSQDDRDFVDWELLAPSVIGLRCGYKDQQIGLRTLSAFVAEELKATNNISSLKALDAKEMAPHGLFHLEFAAYSNFAQVVYFPPLFELTDTLPWFYCGSLDKPSILKGGNGLITLHADLLPKQYEDGTTDNDHRNSARFTASMAHDPRFLLRALAGRSLTVTQGQIYKPGDTIRFPGRQESVPEREFKIRLPDRSTVHDTPNENDWSFHMEMIFSTCRPGTQDCFQASGLELAKDDIQLLQSNSVPYAKALFLPDNRLRKANA